MHFILNVGTRHSRVVNFPVGSRPPVNSNIRVKDFVDKMQIALLSLTAEATVLTVI
jgi:hypothetical protein